MTEVEPAGGLNKGPAAHSTNPQFKMGAVDTNPGDLTFDAGLAQAMAGSTGSAPWISARGLARNNTYLNFPTTVTFPDGGQLQIIPNVRALTATTRYSPPPNK
jgi:hypothetical protein